MDQGFRRGLTAAEKTELWDHWQRGEFPGKTKGRRLLFSARHDFDRPHYSGLCIHPFVRR